MYILQKKKQVYEICIHNLFFSNIRQGLGFILSCLGILFFLLMFHYKLRSIKESSSPRRPCSNVMFFSSFLIFLLSLVLFLIFNNVKDEQIFITNVLYHIALSIFLIFLPRYYISQNPCLKLYVSVYHHQPPPILPWGLPENFDLNSVKLICVQQLQE